MADSPSKKRKLGKPGGSRKGAGAPTNISKLTRGTKGSPAMQDAQSVVRIDTVFFNKSTHPPPPPPSSSSCAQSSAITTASCPSSAAAMSGVPGRTEGAVVNKPFSAELQLGLLQRQMADLRRDMGMKPAGSGGKAGAIETGGKAGAIETGAMGGLQAIFEQLTFATKQLEETGGLPITNYLHVADYMISFCWQSCCGERVGSHINVVKSKGRSTLGDVNFDNAVFNTFNMPPLHHIDYGAFVRAWKKEGTQRMGTLKGASSATGDDDGVDRSEVIRRHLSAGAGTPLYT